MPNVPTRWSRADAGGRAAAGGAGAGAGGIAEDVWVGNLFLANENLPPFLLPPTSREAATGCHPDRRGDRCVRPSAHPRHAARPHRNWPANAAARLLSRPRPSHPIRARSADLGFEIRGLSSQPTPSARPNHESRFTTHQTRIINHPSQKQARKNKRTQSPLKSKGLSVAEARITNRESRNTPAAQAPSRGAAEVMGR